LSQRAPCSSCTAQPCILSNINMPRATAFRHIYVEAHQHLRLSKLHLLLNLIRHALLRKIGTILLPLTKACRPSHSRARREEGRAHHGLQRVLLVRRRVIRRKSTPQQVPNLRKHNLFFSGFISHLNSVSRTLRSYGNNKKKKKPRKSLPHEAQNTQEEEMSSSASQPLALPQGRSTFPSQTELAAGHDPNPSTGARLAPRRRAGKPRHPSPKVPSPWRRRQ